MVQTWGWNWGAGGAYTLQPVASDLNTCGLAGSKGPCCFASVPGSHSISLAGCNPSSLTQQWRLEANGSVINAASNECMTTVDAASDEVGGGGGGGMGGGGAAAATNFQIGLTNEKSWTCSTTAIPPGECCLPVPGQKVSGCHAAGEKRWKFNQFFQVVTTSSTSASASAVFLLSTEHDPAHCMSASGTSMTAASCNPADKLQQWTIKDPNHIGMGNSRIENVGTSQCKWVRGSVRGSVCPTLFVVIQIPPK